jgi:8-oxo-dGTP pyrophosphatase MutT (NUDIX family)
MTQNPFRRHIDACHNAVLPGDRLPFHLAGVAVGWVRPGFARHLRACAGMQVGTDRVACDSAAALTAAVAALGRTGVLHPRHEAFDIRATPDGPVLGSIDRGALAAFGIAAAGVHVNGLVPRADGLHVWVAMRAADKAIDPGKLDHITAGGIPAGLTPWETLLKEAAEEAAIPAALAAAARPVGVIEYAMERPEGLRRDRLYCYDLTLPENFTPHPADAEVAWFALWPIGRVLATVRDTDDFKFNVNLVLIDLFVRLGLVKQETPAG